MGVSILNCVLVTDSAILHASIEIFVCLFFIYQFLEQRDAIFVNFYFFYVICVFDARPKRVETLQAIDSKCGQIYRGKFKM